MKVELPIPQKLLGSSSIITAGLQCSLFVNGKCSFVDGTIFVERSWKYYRRVAYSHESRELYFFF